jgi:thiamine-phosphate pyrophosphorylase
MLLPRLYPIIDLGCFASASDPVRAVTRFAEALLHGGATLIQLRDKSQNIPRTLSCARELRRITQDKATLIINDRADLCLAANADGVHLGQDDLSPQAARQIFSAVENAEPLASKGGRKQLVIGFSTHNPEQVRQADSLPVDYIAVGPVFTTGSKANPDPVIGLEGVRAARAATAKPLVAIGGITRSTCLQVRDAGADAVAVISDLLESPVKAVEEFLGILG